MICNTAFSVAATYEATYLPWSGYWWPFSEGKLARKIGSKYSPLQKYDFVVNGNYYGGVYAEGLRRYYDTDALHWYGMCFNWACSSILEDEPVKKGIFQDEIFTIHDKKGLLAAAYDGALYTRSSVEEPENFHAALENFIREQKVPVVMNLHYNNEFWAYPIYKYDMVYSEVGDTRTYTVTIYYANDAVDSNFIGIDVVSKTYEYYLKLDGDIITESGWLLDAGDIPPRHVYDVYGTYCSNATLDYNTIKNIVLTDDDEFEENNLIDSSVNISSGGYKLLAIDADYYFISMKQGDEVDVRLDDQGNNLTLNFYSPDQSLIQSSTSGDIETLVGDIDGTFFVEVNGADLSSQPDYELFVQHRMQHQGLFPMKPSGSWITELAMLATEDESGRSVATLMDKDGIPVASSSNFTATGKHIQSNLHEEFGITDSTEGYLRIDSDSLLSGYQSITDGTYMSLAANFIPVDTAADELYFPNFARSNGWQTNFGLINIGDTSEQVIRKAYDQNGALVSTDTIDIEAGALIESDTATLPVLTAEAKSMSAETVSGRDTLVGYIEFLDPSFGSRGRCLVPLDMGGSQKLLLPPVAMDEHWWTGVALINRGVSDTVVTAKAYDVEGNLLGQEDFALKRNQHWPRMIYDIIPEIESADIASMEFIADMPLSGFVVYGTATTIQLAGMSLSGTGSTTLTLPGIQSNELWWTGVAVMNDSDLATDVVLTLHRSNGQILAQETRTLQPHQRMAELLQWIFGESLASGADYFSAESANGQPLSGVYIMGTIDGNLLKGDLIQ